MKPITANWKHFYQGYRFFVQMVIPAAVVLFLMNLPASDPGDKAFLRSLGYLIVMFSLGLRVAHLQTSILHKPFSFCLPGHREIPRRFVFQVGVLANLVLSVLFFNNSLYTGGISPSTLLSVVSLGMIIYLLGVWIFLGRTVTMLGFLFGVALVTIVPNTLPEIVRNTDFDLGAFMRNTFMHPFRFLLPICLVFVALLWWRYGQINLGRKVLNSKPTLLFWQVNAKKGFVREPKIFTYLMFLIKPLELYFRRQMLRSAPLSASRYAWGTLRTSHLVSPQAVDNIIILLFTPVALIIGLISGDTMQYFPYFFACNLVVFVEVFPFSVPLLPTGRRDRFRGVLLTGVITGAIVFCYTVVLIVMSRLMAGIMTSIEITRDGGLPLFGLNRRLVLLPVLASALWFTIQLALDKSSLKNLVLAIVVLTFLYIFYAPEAANVIPTYMFFVTTACAWVLFVAAAYYRFFTRDLEYRRSRTEI